MSMFQKSVINSIKQDESLVALRWAKFQEFLAKVDYIKTVKEEKYQDGFLKDVFENCLGYTLDMTNPSNYNLEREKKNETDGKKADGVIYVDNKVIGVIELKAQDTKNLDKIETQAFNYHASHSNSKYIIISNFDELRFYIDKKTAYEKFSLFTLSYEEFKKLHLLISFESIKEDIPLKLKEKTTSFEQNISKELYKDFSAFRTHLFENIIKNNENIDKSTLLRLTQKLCDRIIFILFAEDRGLLTPNTIKEIILRHSQDVFGNSMYEYYKIYFNAINEGNEKLNIPKYNGGLFAKDELLDNLKIDDENLNMEAQKLSSYNFESEISVNILGHIFEQSLTDLEELQSNIENTNFDKTKSKRKKDGVFYTPEYITKYIVENTLGKMCLDKREELNLSNITAPTNPKKLTKVEQQTKTNLEIYKDWLFNLKILDPACGSGAFLNQALEYLIKEHKQLQNDLALMGDLFSSYTVEESVLEHNLYGVDINEDAVEIAKLSLWLRTAQRGRPLTSLADKIICANSLLEMPFEENSFDIVIGNPPYVRQELINKNEKEFLSKNFKVGNGTADLYVYFYEISIYVLKKNGFLGFITPNKFYKTKYGKELREYIQKNKIIKLIDFFELNIFEDASTDSQIILLEKDYLENNFFKYCPIKSIEDFINSNYKRIQIFQNNLTSNIWIFNDNQEESILNKMLINYKTLKDYTNNGIEYGIKTGFNKAYIIDKETKDKIIKEDKKSEELIKSYISGTDIKRYTLLNSDKTYFINTYYDLDITKYKGIYNWLLNYNEELEKRGDKGKHHFNLRACKYYDKFDLPKIIYIHTAVEHSFYYDNEGYYINNSCYLISNADKFLSAFLNSKIFKFYKKLNFVAYGDSSGIGRVKLDYNKMVNVPIPIVEESSKVEFITRVDKLMILNKQLQEIKQNFYNELKLEKLTNKLQKFEELEFDDFIKEYTKSKKIKFADKLEERNFKNDWKALFENDKKEVLEIQNQINKTDKEIDQMVYKLYDLTEDEIKIVENV